jgi:protein-ribulosamine 3-kinase
MSKDIERILLKVLSGVTALPSPGPLTCLPVGGGSINNTYQVLMNFNNRWFCKFNDIRHFPDLFAKENHGLSLLRQQQLFRIPATVACAQVDDTQTLILEWIDQGPRTTRFWHSFGESLARLHQITQPLFGLDQDNYMGALPQDNTPSPNWIDFFIHRRLEPQVKLATQHGLLDNKAHLQFQRLYKALPDIFPPEPPALLHGDLWSGNFLCDTNEQPVLIDPAVYFGHRSIDLAMTTLFGGFAPAFYEAYAYHYPLPSNHRQQWEVANLYPLLIHLNLFGQSYLRNILHTIQHF